MKGYWIIVGVKPLQPIDETFCLFPTNGANCFYLDRLNLWASTAQYEPAKWRSNDGGLTTSLMIKSTKDGEEEEKSTCNWNYLPSPYGGSS